MSEKQSSSLESGTAPPLRVLFLCSWFPNEEKPTLGNFVEKHAEAAARHNRICVLAIFPKEQSQKFFIDQHSLNQVDRTIVYYRKSSISGVIGKVIDRWRYFRAGRKGFRLCNRAMGGIDLVHLNVALPIGLFALYLNRVKRLPFVATEHATAYAEGPNQYPKNVLQRAVYVLGNAKRLLPVSEDLGKTLAKYVPRVPQKVVPNVVDETLFTVASERQLHQFIHISTAVDAHKNVSGILRAMAQLKEKRADFRLRIISDGDLTPHRALAKELNILDQVTFEGRKTTVEIAKALQCAGALLLFSNYENFPCVIAEAFMSGIPVISTNVNGIPEHVTAENGILISPKDEDALVNAMESYLNDYTTFDANKIRAYALEHFSYASVGDQLNSIYREVLLQ